MMNIHSYFIQFDNDKLKLSENRKQSLFASRNALRQKIRSYLSENKPTEIRPVFHSQGSIVMNTAINPMIGDDGLTMYDLDDGVYFISDNPSNERKSIETYHNWVFEAVENHTQEDPIDKTTCVRVMFKDGHHIDLPIYYMVKGQVPELAHKSRGWLQSDPKAFAQWFNDKADSNPQIRRIVRYLKSWKEFREFKNDSLNLPSGFILSILVVNSFQPSERDDQSLLNTVVDILNKLNNKYECYRPTVPVEDLFSEFSDTRRTQFLESLNNLKNNLEKAMSQDNSRNATEVLRKEFGDRFPLGKDENISDKSARIVSTIASAVSPRPYSNNESAAEN